MLEQILFNRVKNSMENFSKDFDRWNIQKKKINGQKQKVFSLKELTDKITKENRHKKTAWGGPVGKEI